PLPAGAIRDQGAGMGLPDGPRATFSRSQFLRGNAPTHAALRLLQGHPRAGLSPQPGRDRHPRRHPVVPGQRVPGTCLSFRIGLDAIVVAFTEIWLNAGSILKKSLWW